MSINIIVHRNALETETRKTVLCDPERVKKEEFDERRKQRLEQVRQQSKSVASQIRKNVGQEIKKQERRIEEQKQKELLEWREKALAEAEEQRKKSLNALGLAHRNALDERENQSKLKYEKDKERLLAEQRGKEAIRKRKDKAPEKISAEKPKVQTPKTHERKPGKSNTKITGNTLRSVRHVRSEQSSSDSSDDELAQPASSLKQNKAVVMDINTDSDDSSSLSVQDSHEDSNRHFYRTTDKSASTGPSKPSYNAHDYRQSETSSSFSASISSDKPTRLEESKPRQFSKISDLVQKRQAKAISLTALDLPATTEPSLTPTKPCLKSKLQAETGASVKIQPQIWKKAASSTKPKSETFNTVQFYDYNNKYSREYEQGQEVVRPAGKPQDKMSAMNNARRELELEAKQREVSEGLRQKSEERGKNAMQRERVRRDCALLTQQLDALNRDIPILREIDGRGAVNALTMEKMEKQTNEREKKMTSAVEDLLSRPINVTCPEVRRRERVTSSVNVANIRPMEKIHFDFANSSTSDSCASILLGYVSKQSEQVVQDIKECGNSTTLEELKCLLKKINDIRNHIIAQINQCKGSVDKSSVESLKNIVESVSDLHKEREFILSEERKSIESLKAQLDRREKRIKKKEKHLDQKLKELSEYQPEKETAKEEKTPEEKPCKTDESVERIDSTNTRIPLEIIIKLRNETSDKLKKSPYKSPRKRSSLVQDFKRTRRKKIAIVKQRADEQADEPAGIQKVVQISPAKSRSSTSYLSVPEAVHTKLGDLLSIPIEERTRHQMQQPTENKIPDLKQRVAKHQVEKKQNPALMHYIQRLLGMSRSSIDMLHVSSSEVTTPSSSVIADPSNVSDTALEKERMQRLHEFIEENYSFINDLEESFKSSKSSGSSSSAKAKVMEKIWRNTLHQQQEQVSPSQLTKEVKSILKKKAAKLDSSNASKSSDKSKNKLSAEAPVSAVRQSNKSVEANLPSMPSTSIKHVAPATNLKKSLDTEQLVDKYTELTQSCTKRIAELTDMISKVREEKQKILEITLTSGSEAGRNSTEYLDLPEQALTKSEESSKIVDIVVPQAVVESERAHLERNKLTGASRDSGISLSRPVTALESHEVQDTRIFGKITPDNQFEFTMKDKMKATVATVHVVSDDRAPVTKKSEKPPPTIVRNSPQLIEEPPHELSTIFEVETPITSRMNASIPENVQKLAVSINESLKTIKRFPTYEEYIAEQNLQVSQFIDVDVGSKTSIEVQDEVNVSNLNKLKYEEFPSLNTYLRVHGQQSNVQGELTISSLQAPNEPDVPNYQRFPSHKSYVERLDITGLLDSQSIAAVSASEHSGLSGEMDDVESTESLPDVVAELKRRNILKHSFQNEEGGVPTSDISTSSNENNRAEQIPPVTARPTLQKKSPLKGGTSSSPGKNRIQTAAQKRPTIASPENKTKDGNLTGIEILPSSGSSRTTSESLEKELDKMGLKWASLMLKKSQKSMELCSSSSSSLPSEQVRRKSVKKSPEKSKVSLLDRVIAQANEKSKIEQSGVAHDQTSEEDGKPFNLKEFFTKELAKRATTSLSLSSNDDSLASLFIKSLLGSANTTPTPPSSQPKTSAERQRHHTSTPVQQKKSSPSSKSANDSSKLFSGESCISSVRMRSQSNSPDDADEQLSLQDRDELSASHLVLDVDKRNRSSQPKHNDKNS